ncbi:unnamed protein product [Cylicocyclus nassatus]|uniref:Uncharacterized protein n=1 Tax=Cylicocyclus nassatus TaxID=53992 RepID=A0AA36GTH7_CYLNA|nr:unnamed protein product [Cylicocyclus nassatus]
MELELHATLSVSAMEVNLEDGEVQLLAETEVMDVSAPVRPPSNFSHSRPTQAYYVPRRLLEGGRGPHPASDGKPSDAFVSADAPPTMAKQRSNTEVRTPSSKTIVKTFIEPRPLMADLLPKPDSLKEKRRPPRLPQQPIAPSQVYTRIPQQPQPFAPRIVNGPRGPLSRPNAFCPLPPPQKDVCICDRPNAHVICKRCGYECIGRVQLSVVIPSVGVYRFSKLSRLTTARSSRSRSLPPLRHTTRFIVDLLSVSFSSHYYCLRGYRFY